MNELNAAYVEANERARIILRVHQALTGMACEYNPLWVRDAARDFADFLDRLEAARIDGSQRG